MQGLHLTADLHDCLGDAALLESADRIASLCLRLAGEVGLTVVGEGWHSFPQVSGRPGGVTGMLLLAESHLALHTWPERGYVTLDVFVCNLNEDNSGKAEALMQALLAAYQPRHARQQRVQRGLPEDGRGI